jgi:hypothetical protein
LEAQILGRQYEAQNVFGEQLVTGTTVPRRVLFKVRENVVKMAYAG